MMATAKQVFEIEVIANEMMDVKLIKVMDENGECLKRIQLADVVFEAVERLGFDCNGCGIEWKINHKTAL